MEIDNKTLIWIGLGVVILVLIGIIIWQTTITGQVTAGGKLDTSSWTENEKMNYEMHGTIPARAGASGTSTGNGMVGGC